MPGEYVDPIRGALFAVLDGDAELSSLVTGTDEGGVFHLRAPAEAEFPYVVFNEQSGLPMRSFRDSSKNQLWLIKGLCRGGDQGEAEAIDARCAALFDRGRFEIEGFDLLGCERGTDVRYPEDDSGETIFHVGALYRVQTYPTA
jgi:hypothetical protein